MSPYENPTENEMENCWKLYKTYFTWYTVSEKMETLQTLWTCGCLKIPYKNRQLRPVSLFSCIFTKTFFPDKNSKPYSYKKLTNITLETLLNEFFTWNPEDNKQRINEYVRQRQVNMTWPTLTALCQSTILVYLKLLNLNRFSLCGEKITNGDKNRRNIFR